ncbi:MULTISPECIES: hypothetical protein [Flavobacteriaceae]|uniref:IPT/TIG domain-containing protein n=2 Tax=Flavobacteriaceae TaxID=49546 RepID=A0A4Y8AWI0_9FLAO|nr:MULTISPECIES: hypothetical protein [Flavobacteriaceae]TEW76495.1 hypothetical protein E2488_01205 [Gramella jeungdoensis]GGK53477.1 hypothetical protein GCM10007963_22190 [Lutibacter litoralis]
MKKYINLKKFGFLILFSVGFFITSCENEFADDKVSHSTKPPVITSVSEAREDTPVQQGVLENVYYIRGEALSSVVSIKYNGYEAGFNPVFVSDDLIISKIPEGAPYISDSNTLTIETLYGVVNYDFSLLSLEEFTEEIVDGKSAVILHGGDFTDVNRVIFQSGTEETGDLVEKEATIMSVSQTEVVVEVPAGIVQAFIYVFTSRGAIVQSASYGFNYPMFTDELSPGWEIGGWDGDNALSSAIALGSTSIERSATANWGGLTFTPGDDSETLFWGDYRTVSFQIYSANSSTKRVKLAFNDFSNAEFYLTLVPNQWTKFVLPLSGFYPAGTAPETITRIDFQMAAEDGDAGPYLYYLDQFGFIQ